MLNAKVCRTDSGCNTVASLCRECNECTDELISVSLFTELCFFFSFLIAIHSLQVWLEVMIFPHPLEMQGAEASLSYSQHKPWLCWLKQWRKLPQWPGLPRSRQGQDLARSCACSKSAKIVVHKTRRSASWITIMEFSLSLFFDCCHPPTSQGCLWHPHPLLPQFVCLYICHFLPLIFSFSPSVSKSPSVRVCLSVSVSPSLVSAPHASLCKYQA